MAHKKLRIPKRLGACADLLYRTRAARLALNAEVDAHKKDETAIKAYMIDNFKKTELQGVQGLEASVSVTPADCPVVDSKNWKRLWAWIFKHKHYDLLPKSISTDAWRQMTAAGIKVPYVTKWVDQRFSITKLPAKKVKARK